MKLILFIHIFIFSFIGHTQTLTTHIHHQESSVDITFNHFKTTGSLSPSGFLFEKKPSLVVFLNEYEGSEILFENENFEISFGSNSIRIKVPLKDLTASGTDIKGDSRFINLTGPSAKALHDFIDENFLFPFRYPGQNLEKILDFGHSQFIICTLPRPAQFREMFTCKIQI